MRAIHYPFTSGDRAERLHELCDFLNAHPIEGSCIKNWYVEDLSRTPDPWRLQLRLKHRLVADLDDDVELIHHINSVIKDSEFKGKIDVLSLSSKLYYEELSLGAVEYRVMLQLNTNHDWEDVWDNFLRCSKVWNSMDFTTLLDSKSFQIQSDWACLRDRFRVGIDACFPGRRFTILEEFLDWKNALPDPKGRSRKRSTSLAEERDDDLLWTQSMDVILYKNPGFQLDDSSVGRVVEMVHQIGLTLDYTLDYQINRSVKDELQTGYHKTSSYLLRVGEENSLDILYSGFGMVALVTEHAGPFIIGRFFGDYECAAWSSPSIRVAALRRRMLINYGALTESADGLRSYLANILFHSSHVVRDRHERLRLIIATLAMVKYDAKQEVTESDDLETYVYGDLARSWGLPQQSDVLTSLTADADTATSRISEATSHDEERTLGILILVLTVATMGGVLSEVYTFIIENEQPKIIDVEPRTLHWILLLAVWVIPLLIAYLKGMFSFPPSGLIRRSGAALIRVIRRS